MARRHKKALDPISLEELTNAPAMSGFVSFLNVKPWESEAVPDQAIDNTETTGVASSAATITPVNPAGTPKDSTTVDTTPDKPTPVETAPIDSTRVGPAPAVLGPSPGSQQKYRTAIRKSTGAASTPVVSFNALDNSILARRPRIHEVRVLPDSLSFGEEALYNALWAHAVPDQAGARRITIGFERMSRIARLTDKNCKLNCRALIQKRVVEEIADTNFREGRTYLVHSPESAVERQRQAGLTHVIRTRGVVFIDPATGRELTTKQWGRKSTPVETTGNVQHDRGPSTR